MTQTTPTSNPIEALDRYLAGESPAAERQLVEAWAADRPERQILLARLPEADDLCSPSAIRVNPADTASAWARFTRRESLADGQSATVHHERPEQPASRAPRHSTPLFRHSWRYGAFATAILALLALVGVQTSSRPGASGATAIAEYTIYTTRPGERTTVTLRDGTKVMLNVASTLEVPRDFGSRTRNVRLVGQAMFDVAPVSGKPFIVDAVGTRTTVLGTVFSVRAYDADVYVAVRSGKIALSPCSIERDRESCRTYDDRSILSANDVAQVTPLGEMHVQHDATVDREFGFVNGRLILTGAPFREVIDLLERWYDVDIQLEDSAMGAVALEGAFPAGSADNLVQVLEVVLKFRVERRDRTIMVLPNR